MAVFTSTAALATAFFSTTVGAAIGQLVVGLALNAITQELFGPDLDDQRSGLSFVTETGADVPRSFLVGRTATRGSLVYHNHWGHTSTNDGSLLNDANPLDPPTVEVNNDYYTRVTALSDAPIHALSALVIDDTYTQIDWANPDTELDRGYPLLAFTTQKEWTTFTTSGPPGGGPKDQVVTGAVTETLDIVRGWVKFYDGTQTVADDFLVKMVGTDERPWTTSHILRGMAYAVLTLRWDEELFARHDPRRTVYICDGIGCTDPRDGQVKSGTRNPILMMREIINGITVEGQWLYGSQRPVALDDTELGAQATLCGLNPPGWDAMTDQEKIDIWGHPNPIGRYLAGAEVKVDVPIAETLERLALSCNAVFADAGSYLRILVGEDQASSASITDDDFRTTQEQTYDPFPPLAEAVNGITATYPSPDDNWEVQAAPPLYNAAFEAEDDGRRLVRNVDLETVPWPEQVERLMSAALAEARRSRTHTGVLPATYWAVEAGDYLTWTSTRNGYQDKLFRVAAAVVLADGDIAVTLAEMDPDAYDWSPVADYVPPTSAPPITQPLPPVKITDFTLSPSMQVDAVGDFRRPSILLQWENPALPGVVTGIQWQVRLAATGVIVASGTFFDLEAEADYIPGLLPGTDYEVRTRWKSSRPSEWSAWVAVSTPDVRLTSADLADTVNTAISDAQGDATLALADAAAAQADHDALVDGFVDETLVAAFASVDGEIATTRSDLESEILLNAAATLPSTFDEDGLYWTSSLDDAPGDAAALQGAVSFVDDPTFGRLAEIDGSAGGLVFLNTIGKIPCVPARTYRIKVEARMAPSADGAAQVQTQIRGQTAGHVYAAHDGKLHTLTAAMQTIEHEFTVPSDGSWDTVKFLRGVFFKNSAAFLNNIQVRGIEFSDITDAVINRAAISQEAITRADEDAALAATITSLTGEVNGNTGDISSILGLSVDGATALGVLAAQLEVDAGGNSAWVSQTGSAVATIEGNMAASYSLGVGAGGAGAGLLLYASDDVENGAPASGVAIRADQLTVSAGRNLLVNTDFSQGTRHWYNSSNIGAELESGIRPAGSSWAGTTFPTYYVKQNGVSSGYMDLRQNPIMHGSTGSHGLPVAPGDWIELSAKLSHHRCDGQMFIIWRDTSGNTVSSHVVDLVGENSYSSDNPNEWPTYWTVADAPAGAAYAEPSFRKLGTNSGTSSWMFVHQPQMTFGHANQLEPTPYARGGVTMIDGSGIVTGSITAVDAVFATGAILEADIGDLQVDTIKIADNAVTVSDFFTEETVTQFRNPNEEFWLVTGVVNKVAEKVRLNFNIDVVGKETLTVIGIELQVFKIQGGVTTTLTAWREYLVVKDVRTPIEVVFRDDTSFTGNVTYGIEGRWVGDSDVVGAFMTVEQKLK